MPARHSSNIIVNQLRQAEATQREGPAKGEREAFLHAAHQRAVKESASILDTPAEHQSRYDYHLLTRLEPVATRAPAAARGRTAHHPDKRYLAARALEPTLLDLLTPDREVESLDTCGPRSGGRLGGRLGGRSALGALSDKDGRTFAARQGVAVPRGAHAWPRGAHALRMGEQLPLDVPIASVFS